jgi:hypothetical protein
VIIILIITYISSAVFLPSDFKICLNFMCYYEPVSLKKKKKLLILPHKSWSHTKLIFMQLLWKSVYEDFFFLSPVTIEELNAREKAIPCNAIGRREKCFREQIYELNRL